MRQFLAYFRNRLYIIVLSTNDLNLIFQLIKNTKLKIIADSCSQIWLIYDYLIKRHFYFIWLPFEYYFYIQMCPRCSI